MVCKKKSTAEHTMENMYIRVNLHTNTLFQKIKI